MSAIPTVNAATLYLYIPAADAGIQVSVYSLTGTVPFSEMQATWNDVATGIPWATVGGGGDFDPARYVVFVPPTSGCWVQLDVTDFAKDWVGPTGKNMGLILIARSTDVLSAMISSREVLNGPRLDIK